MNSIDAKFEHLSTQQRNTIYRQLRDAVRSTTVHHRTNRMARKYGVSREIIIKVYLHVHALRWRG